MRLKLRKNWFYEQNQPASETIQRFHSAIDFNRGPFNHQLGGGWYWHERSEKGFRWTCRRAEIFLESDSEVDYLCLEGYSPENNGLKVYVDGIWIGQHLIQAGDGFKLRFLLPFERTQKRLFSIVLQTERSIESKDPDDNRELGLMVFSLALSL
jgi:hypothetical protein